MFFYIKGIPHYITYSINKVKLTNSGLYFPVKKISHIKIIDFSKAIFVTSIIIPERLSPRVKLIIKLV